jgi:hypothetical protein
LTLLLVPLLAHADVDPRFARVRDAASTLDGSLASFLDRYIGECNDAFEGQSCKQNAAAYRKKMSGKNFYVIIPEEAATMLRPGPYDPRSGQYTVLVTPFFPAGGYALTKGQPKRLDGAGNPVMPLLALHGKMPAGWDPMSFQRLFRRRELRVQLVFSPEGVWSMGKRGGKKLSGVKAKLVALMVTYSRTGDPVATFFAK